MLSLDQFDGYIFDYGGVLAFHQTPEDLARMSSISGISVPRLEELYWERRLEYDEDFLSAAEYWSDVASKGGVTLTSSQIATLIDADNRGWMHYDEVMWNWISELRASGKRTAVLSNMPRTLGEALAKETDRFGYFDHVTLSYELRSAKPGRRIYEHCLEGIKTAPERTLFLDDRIANVCAAQALGIQAIEFTSRDEVLGSLLTR